MSSLVLTIPLTLLLAACLLALVLRAARRGDFDDWEGPAARHAFDDDRTPELEASPEGSEAEPSREAEGEGGAVLRGRDVHGPRSRSPI